MRRAQELLMTGRLVGDAWETFMRDVRPHTHPLLGPYLDALQDAGQPPPKMWYRVPDPGDPGGYYLHTRDPAWATDFARTLGVPVVAVLELPAALP